MNVTDHNEQARANLRNIPLEELQAQAARATPVILADLLDNAASLAGDLYHLAGTLEDEEAAREYNAMRCELLQLLRTHERLRSRGGEPSRPLTSDIKDETIPF